MLGYFGHETSDVVVCVQTGGGGQCVSPGRLSGLTFYSKADCSVTGCLYAISIIMGGRDRPLLHASQRDDTSPPASLPVEPFFLPLLFVLAHCVFPQVFFWCWQSQRLTHTQGLCGLFWRPYSAGPVWLIHSPVSPSAGRGGGRAGQMFRVYAFKSCYGYFIVKFTTSDCLRHCMCACSVVTSSGSSWSEELCFYESRTRKQFPCGILL